jgi:hypothetical protein
MSDNYNAIGNLLNMVRRYKFESYHSALVALIAERDGLKQENDALRSRCKAHRDEEADRVFEMVELRKRVEELESHPPADRDRELRERLVCAALTGILAHGGLDRELDREFDCVVEEAIWMAGKAIAKMRGESEQ